MATLSRENLAKKLLQQHEARSSTAGVMKKRRHAAPTQRGHRLQKLPSPTEKQLQQRESGWNDRFFYEPPLNSNKLPRSDRVTAAAPSPKATSSAAAARDKRIRDERLQYGNSEIKRKAREATQPTPGRLAPLGHFPDPGTEIKGQPSKEAKLRMKALKAIDSRENALYQLNALILCTPVQEALFQPSRPADPAPLTSSTSHTGFQRLRAKAGMALAPALSSRSGTPHGVMTNAREATKMAQKLAEDLQLAGIQCVEAMVEWMLEAGAKAATPPPFIWRDHNYFVKMHSDLDFAPPALAARGINVECFTLQNPLLVRPNQKLGRVLAAQAIIIEMVAMATANAETTAPPRRPFEPVDHGFDRRSPDDGDAHSAAGADRGDSDSEQQPEDAQGFERASADAMILEPGDDEQQDESCGKDTARSELEPERTDAAWDDDHGPRENDDDDASDSDADPASANVLEASSAEELVGILDESLSDLAPLCRAQLAVTEQGDASVLPTVDSARDTARSASEYENSFDTEEDAAEDGDDGDTGRKNSRGDADDDGVTENQASHDASAAAMDAAAGGGETRQSDDEAAYDEEQEPAETDTQEEEEEEEPSSAFIDDADGGDNEDNNQSHEAPESTEPQDDAPASADEPTSVSPSALLQTELQRLATAAGVDVAAICDVDIAASLAWDSSGSAIAAALARQDTLDAVLNGSLVAVLSVHQLLPTTPQTAELLQTPAATAMHVDERLSHECMSIVDSVYAHVASEIERALAAANPLISEIEIDEAVEAAETVLTAVHAAAWRHVHTAVAYLQLLDSTAKRQHARDRQTRRSSLGMSALLRVFYPYLVNLPREKLGSSWRRIARALAPALPQLRDVVFLLDPTCKALLLVASASRSTDEDDAADVEQPCPKVTLVCDRSNVLETSAAALWTKVVEARAKAGAAPSSACALYPFFASPFGEKVVDGLRVEEGEGKGPLKEWTALLSRDMAVKWTDVSIDRSFDATASVNANGNKLVAPELVRAVKPGFEVSWQSSDGERVTRIVNKVADESTLLLDRGVATQSFALSELSVRQPRHAYLEYVKASERFWLNAQTPESPANRRVMRVYGWYLATALAHYTTIDLALHPLLFELLLDETHCVTLDDVRTLDTTLFDSLVQMKSLPPADLRAFLELEGADPDLSVDAYIQLVVDEKFGPRSSVAWQLQELRDGFRSVYSPADLAAVDLSADDLAAVICGDVAGAALDADFSVEDVFRVALDPDFVKCAPLRRTFWRVVNAFEPRRKRKFVKFVTGVETLPLPGTEFLRVEMPFAAVTPAEHAKTLQMLPQSHTCDNTLELPHYWRALCWKTQHPEDEESEALERELATLLAKKLQDAVEYSSGYGLDATSAVTGILSARRRPESAASRCSESYDSLDLPAMGDTSETTDQTERAQAQEHERKEDDDSEDGAREVASSPGLSTALDLGESDGNDALDADEKSSGQAVEPPSPSKSARHRNDVEESYGEGDWEEEEELLE